MSYTQKNLDSLSPGLLSRYNRESDEDKARFAALDDEGQRKALNYLCAGMGLRFEDPAPRPRRKPRRFGCVSRDENGRRVPD